jgi:hypothetical protein
MWQKIKYAIAFLCILVYTGSAAFAVMKIHKAITEQRFKARQEFADIADFASRAGVLGFFTKEYLEDVKAQFYASDAIDALIIYGGAGRAAFEKKAGLILYKGDYPNFRENLRLYLTPQTAPLRAEDGLASISALSPLIDFNNLLSILRSSFLAILIAVTAAFTTLIFDVSRAKNVSATQKDEIPAGPPPKTRKKPEPEPELDPEFDIELEPEIVPELEIIPELEIAPEPEIIPEPEIAPEPEIIPELEIAPEFESAPIDMAAGETGSAEDDLFAASNSIYEEDCVGGDEKSEFLAILQRELIRAEDEGKDIAVLSIEMADLTLESGELVKEAASFFKSGSRFFEKDEQNGIHIIVPGSGVDEIFTAAKEFHSRVTRKAKSRNGGGLFIGISARSSRSVNSANFMNEAEQAVAKARSDTAFPVVAFKVDVQKYNEFIKRQKSA